MAAWKTPVDDEQYSPSPFQGLGPAPSDGQGAQRSAKKPRAKESALLTSSRDFRDTPLYLDKAGTVLRGRYRAGLVATEHSIAHARHQTVEEV